MSGVCRTMSTIFSYCLPSTTGDSTAKAVRLCPVLQWGAAPSPSVLRTRSTTRFGSIHGSSAGIPGACGACSCGELRPDVAGRVTATGAARGRRGDAWAGITDHDVHGRQSERVVEVMHLRERLLRRGMMVFILLVLVRGERVC